MLRIQEFRMQDKRNKAYSFRANLCDGINLQMSPVLSVCLFKRVVSKLTPFKMLRKMLFLSQDPIENAIYE